MSKNKFDISRFFHGPCNSANGARLRAFAGPGDPCATGPEGLWPAGHGPPAGLPQPPAREGFGELSARPAPCTAGTGLARTPAGAHIVREIGLVGSAPGGP